MRWFQLLNVFSEIIPPFPLFARVNLRFQPYKLQIYSWVGVGGWGRYWKATHRTIEINVEFFSNRVSSVCSILPENIDQADPAGPPTPKKTFINFTKMKKVIDFKNDEKSVNFNRLKIKMDWVVLVKYMLNFRRFFLEKNSINLCKSTALFKTATLAIMFEKKWLIL